MSLADGPTGLWKSPSSSSFEIASLVNSYREENKRAAHLSEEIVSAVSFIIPATSGSERKLSAEKDARASAFTVESGGNQYEERRLIDGDAQNEYMALLKIHLDMLERERTGAELNAADVSQNSTFGGVDWLERESILTAMLKRISVKVRD